MRLKNRLRVFFGKEPQGELWDAYHELVSELEKVLSPEEFSRRVKEIREVVERDDVGGAVEERTTRIMENQAKEAREENARNLEFVITNGEALINKLEKDFLLTRELDDLYENMRDEVSSYKAMRMYGELVNKANVLLKEKKDGLL